MAAKSNTLKNSIRKPVKTSILDTKIYRTKVQADVPFMKEKILPAGRYITRITAVQEAVSSSGDAAIDFCYEFSNAKGVVAEAKERCVIDSFHYEKLINALLDAGLPEGATIADTVGIVEDVVIAYPRKGALGLIQQRKPHECKNVTTPTSATEDEEEEDVLVEEDDDEFDFTFDDD